MIVTAWVFLFKVILRQTKGLDYRVVFSHKIFVFCCRSHTFLSDGILKIYYGSGSWGILIKELMFIRHKMEPIIK